MQTYVSKEDKQMKKGGEPDSLKLIIRQECTPERHVNKSEGTFDGLCNKTNKIDYR